MLKWSLPLQRARQNNQNEHIICLIWSSYKAPIKNSPVRLKQSVHRFHKKRPVQPVFTGLIAWMVREANRTAIVSGSVFYWSNCRSDPVLITMHSGGSFKFFWNAFEIILLLGNNVRNNKRWSLDSCVYVCYIRNRMYHFFLSPVQIKGSLYWLKQEMFMELLQRTMYAHII